MGRRSYKVGICVASKEKYLVFMNDDTFVPMVLVASMDQSGCRNPFCVLRSGSGENPLFIHRMSVMGPQVHGLANGENQTGMRVKVFGRSGSA